jgi:hypothetical protein
MLAGSRWQRSAALRGLVVLLILISDGLVLGQKARVSVPLCRGVTLSASYLSQTGSGEGQGFQFSLTNDTPREIRLMEPVPSSSHWYALTRGKWLWRASSGAGGSLLDATNEKGRVLVYQMPPRSIPGASFTVQPHQTRRWLASERENPVLEYKPGCPKCSYPGEREYRVVFAYAYLPAEKDETGLLACGIRSNPVPMPPKQ